MKKYCYKHLYFILKKKNIMSNDSTNKVDPVIKCFFVSFCTVMALVFILSFSIKVLIFVFCNIWTYNNPFKYIIYLCHQSYQTIQMVIT